MAGLRDLHPGLKIVAFGITFSILPFLLRSLWTTAAAVALLVVINLMAGVTFREARLVVPALGVVVITVVSWLLLNAGGPDLAVVRVGPVTWHVSSLSAYYAVRMASRTVIWVGAYLVLLATTSNRDFVLGLRFLRVPRAGAVAFAMTLKFWGQVTRDALMIAEAQKARGVDFHRGPRWRLFYTRFVATLVPIFFVMFKRFRTMSYALSLRGFGARGRPSEFYQRPLLVRDLCVFAAILLAELILVAWDGWLA